MSLCTISAASPSTLKEQRRKEADPKFTWLGGVRVSLGLELKILGTPLHTTSGFSAQQWEDWWVSYGTMWTKTSITTVSLEEAKPTI